MKGPRDRDDLILALRLFVVVWLGAAGLSGFAIWVLGSFLANLLAAILRGY